eukprot:scaffold87520_cov55-Phaeocystis_antarctica.AAC.6
MQVRGPEAVSTQYGTPQRRVEYHQVLARWLGAMRQLGQSAVGNESFRCCSVCCSEVNGVFGCSRNIVRSPLRNTPILSSAVSESVRARLPGSCLLSENVLRMVTRGKELARMARRAGIGRAVAAAESAIGTSAIAAAAATEMSSPCSWACSCCVPCK